MLTIIIPTVNQINGIIAVIQNVNPIRTEGGVNLDPHPLRFLCSYYNCVKDIDLILIDFSSGGITHISNLKLFDYVNHSSFCNHLNFLVYIILKSL